jgi:hypothetical protein
MAYIKGAPGLGATATVMSHTLISSPYRMRFKPDYVKNSLTVLLSSETSGSMAIKLAYAVSMLNPKDMLTVLVENADNMIFSNFDALDVWKMALDSETPTYVHNRNICTMRKMLLKQGQTSVVAAIDKFTPISGRGLEIPMNQVKFIMHCNKDYRDPKSVRGKKANAAQAILDRVTYTRID